MEDLLGNAPGPFLIVLAVFVPLAYATGQGVASRWEPRGLVIVYCILLAATERFTDFALAEGHAFAPVGCAMVAVVLCAVGLLAWQLTLVGMMVRQYPWLYERSGPLNWRSKSSA
jgi:hypothetical protein